MNEPPSIELEGKYNHNHSRSGQYFFTIIFLFTLPMAFLSMLSTSFRTLGILYAAISDFSFVRRL